MVLRTKPRLPCILGKHCILTWLCPLQSIRNKLLGTDLWWEEFLYVLLDLVCKKAMFLSSIYDLCFIFILWVMTSLFSLLLQLSQLCNAGHSFRLTIESKYILSFHSLKFKGQFSHYGRIWKKMHNFSIHPTPDDPLQCPPALWLRLHRWQLCRAHSLCRIQPKCTSRAFDRHVNTSSESTSQEPICFCLFVCFSFLITLSWSGSQKVMVVQWEDFCNLS